MHEIQLNIRQIQAQPKPGYMNCNIMQQLAKMVGRCPSRLEEFQGGVWKTLNIVQHQQKTKSRTFHEETLFKHLSQISRLIHNRVYTCLKLVHV